MILTSFDFVIDQKGATKTKTCNYISIFIIYTFFSVKIHIAVFLSQDITRTQYKLFHLIRLINLCVINYSPSERRRRRARTTIASLSRQSFVFSHSPRAMNPSWIIARARRHERLFTAALGPGTGPRTTRIPWRRTTRPAKSVRRRRTSWSRRSPAVCTTIRRRMIRTSTMTTSGCRRPPASVAIPTTTTTTTTRASPCSRRRITSSRVPRCRRRESVHPAGDARAAPSRACRCSSSARRRRRHPARAPPVSKSVLLLLIDVCRLRPHCVRIVACVNRNRFSRGWLIKSSLVTSRYY